MLRFIFLLSSVFLNMFDINENYCVPVNTSFEEVISENDGIKLINRNGYIFLVEDKEISLNIANNSEIINYYKDNGNINVLYFDNEYYLKIINIATKEEDNQKIIDYLNLSFFKDEKGLTNCFMLDDLTIAGTINDNDVFIANKEIKIFKSKNKEYLKKIIKHKSNYYLYIEKDLISENPFGNGSENILVKLNENFDIEKIIYLSDSGYIDIISNNNFIYIYNDNKIEMYEENLKFLNENSFESLKQVFSGENGLLLANSRKNIYLVDGFNLNKIKEIKDCDVTIKKFSNCFNIYYEDKSYDFDIIDLTKIIIPNDGLIEYCDYSNTKGFFGNCEYINTSFTTYFDKGIFGTYDGTIEYKTINDTFFTVDFKINIPLKVNVIEGGVYNSGYNILYNGIGTLDGENIYNNEKIYEEGMHKLVIEGNNETKTINFFIDIKQIELNTCLVNNGKQIKLGDKILLELTFDNYENYKVLNVNVLNGEFDEFTFTNGKLVLDFGLASEVKNIEYFIKSIIFEVYGVTYEYYVGEVFYLNIVNKEDIVYLKSQNNTDITFTSQVQAHMFYLKVNNKGVVNDYYYGIYNQAIPFTENDTSYFELYIVYDKGNSVFENTLLTNGYSQGSNLLNVEINKYQNNLEEFTLKFNKENLKSLKVLEKEVNISNNINTEKIIFYGVISFLLAFIIGKLMQVKIKQKEKTIE